MFTIMFISFFLGTIMKQREREHFAPFYSLTNIVNIRARGHMTSGKKSLPLGAYC